MTTPGPLIRSLGGDSVTRIFVHDLTACPEFSEFLGSVPGARHFDERAFLLARPQDIVCVLKNVDNAFLDFVEELGLGLRRERIVVAGTSQDRPSTGEPARLEERLLGQPHLLERIATLIDRSSVIVLDTYMASDRDGQLAAAIAVAVGRPVQSCWGTPQATLWANRKHHIRRLALELDIPVAPGEVVELTPGVDGRPRDLDVLIAAIDRQRSATGRVIVRGALGASGCMTLIVDGNETSLQRCLAQIGSRALDLIYLVEVFYECTVSPNVLVSIEPGEISLLAITDQVLGNAVDHQGNSAPTTTSCRQAMERHALRLASSLHERGFAGQVGLDFCETEDEQTGAPRAFLAEVNPRVNGATYLVAIREQLAQRRGRRSPGAVVVRKARTPARSFADLARRIGPSLYDATTCRGMVPYGIASLGDGEVFLAAFSDTVDDALSAAAAAIGSLR